ncbi:MAG TPA: nucleoside hydrolase [Blastocatellia bacterium]|nr:nucleoside hydrolase [Blastocatellia bacterium]
MKIHLDTDLGGDIDDICALAMLLCWPQEIQITGITTVGEINGRRAGQVKYALRLADRDEIPVAAGADNSQGFYPYELGLPPEERYWPEPIAPVSTSAEEAVHLLKSSIDQGATIIAIGPYTNLFLLEKQFPGSLQNARLFLMGGYVYPPREGFPQWQATDDFNVQVDAHSAYAVIKHSNPTFIPLTVTVETALRRTHLERLRKAGALGQLLARQAEAFAEDEQLGARLGQTCPSLPSDFINFQHDPLACAVALGWRDGVEISELPLRTEIRAGALCQQIVTDGKPTRMVTKIDGDKFSSFWLDTVAVAG